MVFTEVNETLYSNRRDFENETTIRPTLQEDCNFGGDPKAVQVARIVAYCLIIVISTIGNSVIIAVVCRESSTRKLAVNTLIVNLAATDLTITLMYMPRAIVIWLQGTKWFVEGTFGRVLCKTVPFVHGVSILVSILTLLAMAVDRLFVIVFPFKQKFTVNAFRFIIAFVWLLAIAVRFPYLYSLKLEYIEGREEFICSADLERAFDNKQARKIYYTFLLVVFYGFPFIVIIASYAAIVVTLRRNKPLPDGRPRGRTGQKILDRASRKVSNMLLTVTAAFLFCWLTYFVAQIVYDPIPCSWRFWRLFLAHSNSALNPCLFAVFNQKFRRAYKHLFTSSCCG